MAQVESEFVRHIPCPECGSSDANSLYSDGHTFCFKCHHRTNGDYTSDHTTMPVQEITLRGQAERLKKRRIPVQVCERYKIYKGSKTTYAMWCEKHDILWSSYQNIPESWLK